MFDKTRLLDVNIELAESDWRKIASQSRNFAASLTKQTAERPFEYVKGDVTINGHRVANVGVRKKGFIGSLDDRRPSLKIKFDEYQENGAIGGLTRLTLNNNKQDGTLVSTYLSYYMFRQAGLPAPRCNFAKVTVNGKYLGIYSHVESIKPPFLERTFGNSNGNLYEGTLADFFADRLQRFERKTNKETADVRADLLRVCEILAEPNDQMVAKVKEVVDYDSFVRFWAVESLIGFWDGYAGNQNNFFVYNNPATGKFHFIPWGADSSFGPAPWMLLKSGPKSVKGWGLLCNRLYADDAARNEYRQVLLKLMDEVWREEDLLKEVDRIEALLKDDLGDRQKGFTKALDRTRKFIKNRRAGIMAEVKDGPVKLRTEARRPIYFAKTGDLTGSFSSEWQESSEGAAPDAKPDIVLKLNGKTVEFTELSVKVAPGQAIRGPGAGRREPQPTLVFTGKRKSNRNTMTIYIGFEDHQFDKTNENLRVQGMLMEKGGFFGFGGGPTRMLTGFVKLTKTGREEGAPVEGEVELTLFEMRGLPFSRK
ncbi:MAG: CotH kinase family protein [Pirellulaceae bacterium]|nr:CotH kinase family protein [Pirellulaceae bacterium]